MRLEKGTFFKPKSPRILKSIMDAWIKNNIDIATAWVDYKDVPWWYNERALLSVLSGAVWQTGGIAFEEYRTTKKWKYRRKAVDAPYQGRQDINFKIGSHEFIGEAKGDWSGSKSKDPAVRINAVMNKARRDMRVSPSGATRRLAIIFIRPYIKKTTLRKYKTCVEDELKNWLKKVMSTVQYSCCAWVFPKNHRTATARDDKNVYPGAMVFIREVKRRSHAR